LDQDGYWHFGLELGLPSRYSDDPSVRCSSYNLFVLFHIGIKKRDGSFLVRMNREPFTVLPDREEDYRQIVDYILNSFRQAIANHWPGREDERGRARFGFYPRAREESNEE
jgi:hypothetical protein